LSPPTYRRILDHEFVKSFTRSVVTERKPPGITWETWIDRQIRVGMENGAFDGLPGRGKPMRDLDRPRDEMWWVRDKVRRENLTHVPPTVQVRRELDAALAGIAAAPSEAVVRDTVARINERVRWVNSRPTEGPPSTVAPLDADAEVAAWRAARAGRVAEAHAPAPVAGPEDAEAGPADDQPTARAVRRRRWWRRSGISR
jgi:hypothetical protein